MKSVFIIISILYLIIRTIPSDGEIIKLGATNTSEDCGASNETLIKNQIKKTILCHYVNDKRPVKENSTITLINMNVIVLKMYETNRADIFYLETSFILKWKDEYLNWNPASYDNTQKIPITSEDIWRPKLELRGDGSLHDNEFIWTCTVTFDGNVDCDITRRYRPSESFCEPFLKLWPFDHRVCEFEMVVSDDEDAVEEFVSGKLQFNSSVRVDFNYPDGTWQIKNERVINNPAQQKGVHFFAKIQLEIFRHSGMIVTTIHMPAICLMVVNLVSLLYGFNGYVRFILLGLDLVTHFEFLLYLGQKIPPSGDDVPNVILYFRDSMFITLALLLETVLLNCLSRSITPVPGKVQAIKDTLKSQKAISVLLNEDVEIAQDTNNLIVNGHLANGKTGAPESNGWIGICRLIDRVLMIIITLVYVALYIGLYP